MTRYLCIIVTVAWLLVEQASTRADTVPEIVAKAKPAVVASLGELDYAKEISDLTEAIRLDPNSADAYNNRGNAYYNHGNVDQAISDYSDAIRLDPNYVSAYNNRGNAYEKQR